MQETWSDHFYNGAKEGRNFELFLLKLLSLLGFEFNVDVRLKIPRMPHHSDSMSQDLDMAVFITFQQMRMLTRRAYRTSLMHVSTIWRSNRFHFAIYMPVDYGGN